jgi:predicted exporter/SAM-dependent methyltransferase
MNHNDISRTRSVRWPVALAAAAAVILLISVVPSLVTVENDVLAGLPASDPIIADTRYAVLQHGVLDTILIDLSLPGDGTDPNVLVAAAERIASSLEGSGLFLTVGGREYGESLTGLLSNVAGQLPFLLDEQDFRDRVDDLLRPERIREALRADAALLRSLEGIGQAELIARDPLGLRNQVLSRLGFILPSAGARIMRGQILSMDRRHLLLPARPSRPATDTVFAGRLDAAIAAAESELRRESPEAGRDVRVVSVGAFRSTLDNERISRQDARRAALISFFGIALLLVLCFPRPWLGLLCLVPAVAGTALSLFTISLLHQPLSILALGFGGALIGIAVDQGIAYFTFLDREDRAVSGWEASTSVWVVSLSATLTTVGSFLALQFSGFPMLRQLGLFAALGAFFAFLFVHLVFPSIFATVPPAGSRKKRAFRLTRLTTALALGGGGVAASLALLLFVVMIAFARPRFQGDLRALNTVSPETIQDERAVEEIWGNVLGNIYILLEADSPAGLQARSDGLYAFLRRQEAEGTIGSGFTPSMIFPGREAAAANLAAWRNFWTPERTAAVRARILDSRAEFGFSARAFEPFFRSIEDPSPSALAVPPALYPLVGIVRSRDGTKWMTLNPVAAGPAFDHEMFARGVKDVLPGARIIDTELFADRLAGLLVRGFGRMLLICVGGLAIVLFLFFVEATIPLLVLGHTVFALVCTLGTQNILSLPMNVPGLALAIFIPGMGSDFALFFARSHQRYLDERQPSPAIFRNAVFLSAVSAMIGFGGLAVGRHVLLRNIGFTGLLAIGYSALGAFTLLPPALRRIFRSRPWPIPTGRPTPGAVRALVRRRYRHLEISIRLFVRLKLRFDPMFPKLREFAPSRGTVLDIGCGYGVPGSWLLAQSPELRLVGLESDPGRAAVARRAFGNRGEVVLGAAPAVPDLTVAADAALLIDVVHNLPDEDLRDTLRALFARLKPGGRLILRATVPGLERGSWPVRIEQWKWKAAGRKPYLRTAKELRAAALEAGYTIERLEPCTLGSRMVWILATR